jgi:hypothetical protein
MYITKPQYALNPLFLHQNTYNPPQKERLLNMEKEQDEVSKVKNIQVDICLLPYPPFLYLTFIKPSLSMFHLPI